MFCYALHVVGMRCVVVRMVTFVWSAALCGVDMCVLCCGVGLWWFVFVSVSVDWLCAGVCVCCCELCMIMVMFMCCFVCAMFSYACVDWCVGMLRVCFVIACVVLSCLLCCAWVVVQV